jgi:two-component system sensor histidine kinase KdpD
VLVCVGAAPTSARLVRAASRIAQRLHAPWVAAYVEPPATTLRGTDRERLEGHLRLAESLGAQVVRLAGTDVAGAVLAWARKHNVTRIVIGKPTHSWWRDRLRGSLLDAVVRGSGDIDVHVIAGDGEADGADAGARAAEAPERVDPRAWGAAVLMVLATTATAATLRAAFAIPDVEVLYFLAVMVTGALWGRGPSVLAAALGVVAYDFFFVPPFFTLAVADGRYVLTFVMMFAVGVLVSELVARIRRQEKDAVAREERTASLYALTRDLGAASDRADAARVLATHVAEALESDVTVFGLGERGELEPLAAQPQDAALESSDDGVVRWAHEHGKLAGLGTDTLPGARIVACPLRATDSGLGVVALRPRTGAALRIEQRDLLEVLCRQAALVFERSVLAEEAERAVLRARTEELRSSLLSAVSHDLRTPLAAITGAAATVRDEASLDGTTKRELLDTVCDEAERLERLVANLLDMTRLESGAVVLRRDWVPLEELVGSALTRLERRLAGREVHVDLAASPLLVPMDPILVEQVLVNLLENAAKHTPAATPIDIRARGDGERVVVEVSDRGPGLPPGDPAALFEKFRRGAGTEARGAGLGLAICRGIVTAHGGQVEAEDRTGGGATFRFTLPIEGAPPSLPPELREEAGA